jgi:hypothetical protein
MRNIMKVLLAGLVVAFLAGDAKAYYPPGYYFQGYGMNPYIFPPAGYGFSAYASAYGYRSYSSYGVYPGPLGYVPFYNYGTFVRPYVTGPMHSVYWNPFTNTYNYGPGYFNAPNYFYYYGY